VTGEGAHEEQAAVATTYNGLRTALRPSQ